MKPAATTEAGSQKARSHCTAPHSLQAQPRPALGGGLTLLPPPLLALQLFELLERRIEQPDYVGTLAEEQHRAQAPGEPPPGPRGAEVLQADWWELKSDGSMNTGRWRQRPERARVQGRPPVGTTHATLSWGGGLSEQTLSLPPVPPCAVSEATGDYVFVEREDVVEALSAFIAAYVASLPDTRGMDPRQMQQAIAIAFQVRLG